MKINPSTISTKIFLASCVFIKTSHPVKDNDPGRDRKVLHVNENILKYYWAIDNSVALSHFFLIIINYVITTLIAVLLDNIRLVDFILLSFHELNSKIMNNMRKVYIECHFYVTNNSLQQ